MWSHCGRSVKISNLFSIKIEIYILLSVIDVGSEWRTFSNEKASVDPSRVGGPENPLLSGGDLSTMIGPGTGSASFDAFGSKLMRRLFLTFNSE